MIKMNKSLINVHLLLIFIIKFKKRDHLHVFRINLIKIFTNNESTKMTNYIDQNYFHFYLNNNFVLYYIIFQIFINNL